MDLNRIEEKMRQAEGNMKGDIGIRLEDGVIQPDSDLLSPTSLSIERLGWDELSIEQKIERMRDIVKGINANSQEHWRRLEQLGQQMRHHSHGGVTGVVLMPLDLGGPGYGIATEAQMPGGKVYF